MADVLDQTRAGIENRIKELRPLYDEYLKLERAKVALDGVEAPRRGPGRPRSASSNGATAKPRRRGQRSGGTRADQALEAVRQNPGIGVTELAGKLGIKQKNYLYRVMANLQGAGAVKKQGRGFIVR